MTDVIILWDKPVYFERLFQEYGINTITAMPGSLNSPHLAPAKMILIPAGFLSEKAISAGLNQKKVIDKLKNFVENGGTLLIFSPMADSDFSWLSLPVRYKREDIFLSENSLSESGLSEKNPLEKNPLENKAADLLLNPDLDEYFCDGYFENLSEKSIFSDFESNEKVMDSALISVLKTDCKNRPVHLRIGQGKGQIILSTVHEFFSKKYFKSLLTNQKIKI
ncbi:hypothetical protein [Methanolapillus ohkumae]|uniref:Uncharacterized protein n=1 Tax=Methanolapillus ohkumae TaxID=3028298 RepID=A0AA96V463_9EURY|nr:hypothetical protein MsAm2_00220 [Methanosarcinaceae archaeon Am2]